jgi:hypothetical protein
MRALTQLAFATLTRAPIHRLVLIVAAAVAATGAGSVVLVLWRDGWVATLPETQLLIGLPVASAFVWLLGYRIAIGLPAEPKSSWIFEVTPVDRLSGRRAARRMLLLFGWLPLTTLTAVLYFALWPWPDALFRTTISGLSTLWFVEVLLWSYAAVPCVSPPASHDLKIRIVVLAALLDVVAVDLPSAELFWSQSVRGRLSITIITAGLWLGSRFWTDRFILSTAADDEGTVALGLDIMPSRAGTDLPRH